MAASVWTVGGAADNLGERVYENNCKSCHGPEGPCARGPKLVSFKWSDEEALALITASVV